ncbi:3-methyl-2-oxobutanoate dehydrogenase subunit VorB [Christensenella tenuis]|uniref:3-methyl-2-oxobutanoate dehydrogenase subunit VorB n=1 Tax=Christensenella tenuis TaxID=2763033 RepID=A0ABR7EE84_9FIRM|nr:3-methyl-2-oxobutanoate dehydrogenase subunit VorB [Christensenella tenuis]MBC5648089.1 3-methyl-2-oxobutanoate dehydrogenase subunit VorB [Christensenella tenuis]
MAKVLMKGNEAIAEAAIKAGCTHYFGYPITPQNQIPEYMSKRMPQVGGTFIQAESEVSAINMVYGAAGAGARAMTSSSSPGISLKQEGLSYIACAQLPCVVVNMIRSGPGLGGILPSQGDYFQATKGGGHGDYHLVVLAPSGVQEAADLVAEAFDIADEYRIPVMILGDGMIGQMMEPVEFKKHEGRELPEKTWAANGWKNKNHARRVVNSLYIEAEAMEEVNRQLQEKYAEITKKETRVQEFMTEDADYIIAAFGTTARIAKNAALKAREMGIKVGVIRPITLWPFPAEAFAQAAEHVKGILCVEMNTGQMVEDVKLSVNGKVPVEFYGTTGGFVPTPAAVVDALEKLKEGK